MRQCMQDFSINNFDKEIILNIYISVIFYYASHVINLLDLIELWYMIPQTLLIFYISAILHVMVCSRIT